VRQGAAGREKQARAESGADGDDVAHYSYGASCSGEASRRGGAIVVEEGGVEEERSLTNAT
jgi:hypothetical protein